MDYALEVTGLRKEYKDFALKDVSFRLPKGTIMGLIGPNGAGKTTIIKLIMNLVRRKAGEIRIFGKDNLRCEAEVKSRIGWVYEEPHFHEDASLQDVGSAIAPFYENWDDRSFQSLLEEFDLPGDRKFKKLSHGMRMKFSIALALSHGADLLLMDEPTSGLDPVFRRELLERLSLIIQDENKAILFSTQITSDLERAADYVTLIRNGEILFSEAKDELKEKWAIVKGGEELARPAYRHLFKGLRKTAFGVEALTQDIHQARRALDSGSVFEKASLEDIMVFLEKGEENV